MAVFVKVYCPAPDSLVLQNVSCKNSLFFPLCTVLSGAEIAVSIVGVERLTVSIDGQLLATICARAYRDLPKTSGFWPVAFVHVSIGLLDKMTLCAYRSQLFFPEIC